MITVYTKPGCPACVGTMRYLDRHGLTYRIVDILQHPVGRAYVVSLGYTSLPVVEADGEHWCGLKIDKLAALSTTGDDNVVIES